MSLSKKHYEAIARIVRGMWPQDNENGLCVTDPYTVEMLGKEIADYFAADNPRFDRARFLKACGLEWSGSPDPADPDNYWIDDETGQRIKAEG